MPITQRDGRTCRHWLLKALRLVLIPIIAGGGTLASPTDVAAQAESLPPNTVAETFLANAGGYVVAMAFAPDGRLFYTTKGGFGGVQSATVRIVEQGSLRATPFLSTLVDTAGERGLLGIALDPNFNVNRYVYLYKTAPASETGTGRPSNRVLRYTENPITQTAIPDSLTLLLDVPIGPENDPNTNHNGGNLHFGPDGKLYVSIGDYGRNPANAQDLGNRLGKIHRLNPDGSVPSDNPFVADPTVPTKSIWTYGNRNSFDFVFDPVTGRMFFTENGPNCDDEVNLGQAGGNYGWPNPCGVVPPGTIAPLHRFPAPIGITGIDVYQGPLPEWNNTLFWCAVNSGELYHAQLDVTRTLITSVAVVTGAPACTVDVQHGPDGALYVSSASTISRIRLAAQFGGNSLGISSNTGQVVLTWGSGSAQTGYWVYRAGIPSGTATLLPSGDVPLPAKATAFSDLPPATDPMQCYLMLPLVGTEVVGASDALCALPNTGAGALRPVNFTLRLDQSEVARLTWTAPGNQEGYVLVASPLDGSPPRVTVLAAGATSATDALGPTPTCYVLVAATEADVGYADMICGIPGTATLGSMASVSDLREFPDEAITAARAALQGVQ